MPLYTWPLDAPIWQRLIRLSELLAAGAATDAEAELRACRDSLATLAPAQARLAAVCIDALLARIAGSSAGGNLYVQGATPDAMLSAFHVLATETPLIRFGYVSANLVLLDQLARLERAWLLDIGIGMGTQWSDLLQRMAAQQVRVPLHITGVEVPAASGDTAQRMAAVGQRLRQEAEVLRIPLTFDAVIAPIETLTDLRRLQPRQAPVLVNAVLSLHHILPADVAPEPAQSREAVLARICALEPTLLTVVEVDSEHSELAFTQRVPEALRHYAATFDALATLLPERPDERALIEQLFFGREIHNVLACEGAQRVERHQRLASWQRRFSQAGLHVFDLAAYQPSVRSDLACSDLCAVQAADAALRLVWRDQVLLSAMAWTS